MISDFDFSKIEGFDWDKGNIDKNLKKHNVVNEESEEIFSNNPFVVQDLRHSKKEQRFQAMGITHRGRLLFVTFTVRNIDHQTKIRIISSRDMNRKEEIKYEEIQNNT